MKYRNGDMTREIQYCTPLTSTNLSKNNNNKIKCKKIKSHISLHRVYFAVLAIKKINYKNMIEKSINMTIEGAKQNEI